MADDVRKERTAESKQEEEPITFVVLGASGDLAKKKTFPTLFQLYAKGLLPSGVQFVGFARSEMSQDKFRSMLEPALSSKEGNHNKAKKEFLDRCVYFQGQYNSTDSFAEFHEVLKKRERDLGGSKANRIFYLAIPPTVFVDACKSIRASAMSESGWTRLILEKPFGKDSKSSAKLAKQLSKLFTEEQIFRIDHYLGKEMVQNLTVLRFANQVFEPIWNRQHIANVMITFKEDFGVEGRGSYFDEFGMIRDVMQNHLIQVLSQVAMEPPVTLGEKDVHDEKTKLLRSVAPLKMEDLVIGQYTASEEDPKDKEGKPMKKQMGYREDPTVPDDSMAETFAAAVLHINNSRWKGTPFILKCGKGLDERKTEVRIQFHAPANGLFPDDTPNELVLRIQPNTSIYMKLITKKPGLTEDLAQTELDLTYGSRFGEVSERGLPDAYERLILDVIQGDHHLFVRDDELAAAWDIFDPVLHELDRRRGNHRKEADSDKAAGKRREHKGERKQAEMGLVMYPFGSRGLKEADELAARYGFRRTPGYHWPCAY